MKRVEPQSSTNNQSVDSQHNRAQSPADLSIAVAVSPIAEFTDNRPAAVVQREFQAMAGQSPQGQHFAQLQSMVDKSPRQMAQRQQFAHLSHPPVQRQGGANGDENRSGIPDSLKGGLEQLSGMELSAVRVHYNSAKPAQLNADAYAQGQEIHLGPGQEKHLPHEGWHAVQQMQGRVKPTIQARGVSINDDEGLEREADVMGAKAAAHQPSKPLGSDTKNATAVAQMTSAVVVQQRKSSVVQTRTAVIQLNTEQDKLLLAGERDKRVPVIIEKMKAQRIARIVTVRQQLLKPLRKQSKALVKAGIKGVNSVEIDAQSAASQDHLTDVKGASQSIAEQADIIAREDKLMEILRDFTLKNKSHTSTLKNIVNGIYDAAERNVSEDIMVMYERVYQSALGAANAKNLELLSAVEQGVKNKWASDEFSSSINVLAEKTARESTVEEVAVRAIKDPLVQGVVDEPLQLWKEKLCVDLTKYLEKKVGALGVGFTRSDKVKSFNKKLKEASHEQISKQATEQLSAHFESQEPGDAPATQKYNEMKRKQSVRKIQKSRQVKKQAAGKVNEVLTQMTNRGVTEVLPKFEKMLKQAATTAAWSVLRTISNDVDEKAINQKKVEAGKRVKKKLKSFYKEVLQQAKNSGDVWSHKTIKGDKSGDEAQAAKLQQSEVANVKAKVEQSDIASGVVNTTLAAASPDKSVGAIGKLLDTLVPNPGDSVFLNLTLKIPVYSAGAQVYVLIQLKGQAHRGRKGAVNAAPDIVANDTWLEVRGDIIVGGGVQILGLSADVALNFFARVGAKDTAKTMKAFSLALYKLMGEKNKKLAACWANGGKVDGMTKKGMAETWVAMAEEQAFDKGDATVDLGVLARLKGQATLSKNKGAALSIKAGGGLFWRLNKGVLDKQKAAKEAKASESSSEYSDETIKKIAEARAAGKSKKVIFIKVAVATKAGTFAASLAIVKGGPWDLKLSATVPLPSGDAAGAEAVRIAEGITNTFRALYRGGVAHMKEESSSAKKSGTLADILGQLPGIATGLGAKLTEAAKEVGKRDKARWQQGNLKRSLRGKQVDDAKKAQMGILGFKHKCKLTINGGYQAAAAVDGAAPKILDGLVIRGEFVSLQGIEVAFPLGTVKVAKGRSLFSVGWQKGTWEYTVLY